MPADSITNEKKPIHVGETQNLGYVEEGVLRNGWKCKLEQLDIRADFFIWGAATTWEGEFIL